MKWSFEVSDGQAELEVILRKARLDQEVQDVMTYLEGFGQSVTELLPIKTAERVQLVSVADMIAVEVDGGELQVLTTKGSYRTVERLIHFQERVNHPDLLQISRYGLINIKQLQYLEHSFSGNMTAVLTGKTKVTVSRRYLKYLEKKLGL
ncbi:MULTISPECIES: LytTR family DNA-binding domain-containing protein [unclassified Streptococcus]|uniref:LytTR family DNA-binding domain-containing protein n=1 Tax=unclassified Streptococcus TaxID=2608887 RepID=UPI00359DF7C1